MVARLRGCSYRCRRGCEQRVAWQMQIYEQIWRARLKNAALQSGFSRSAVAARGRLIRGHGAPRAAQRPLSTRRWPVSRLPSQAAPSHERNGTLVREPWTRALGARPARRRGLARARQLSDTSPLCNATGPARGARITAPFRAPSLIQTPAAAAAVTRASVRSAHRVTRNQGQPQRASHLIRDATPRLRRAPRREPGRGHPAAARLDHF